MISSQMIRVIARRLAAALLVVAPLIAWPILPAPLRANIPLIAGAVLLALAGVYMLTRRSGRLIGMGAGVVSGFAIAIVIAPSIPGIPGWVGFAVAGAAFGVVGHLSGFGRPMPIRLPARPAGPVPPLSNAAPGGSVVATPSAAPAGGRQATMAESLRGVLEELCRFLHREADYQRAGRAPTWLELNQFVRDALRARIGAVGVNIYRLSDDAERLLPLDWSGGPMDQLPTARDGVIGWVISSGKIFISDGASAGDGAASRWAWLLPLKVGERVRAIVAVDQFTRSDYAGLQVATAVRDQLQMAWTAVSALQALEFAERSASARGLLVRGELLTVIDRAVREAKLSGEVVHLMTLVIEGVRRLDDEGYWAERDHLAEQVAAYLRSQVSGDHAIGRFSDDRFVVVIRRMDTFTAGQLTTRLHGAIVSKLTSELERIGGPSDRKGSPSVHQIRVRAATVGCEFSDVPDWRPFPGAGEMSAEGHEQQTLKLMGPAARELLLRCFGLLEFARAERVDIVHDTLARLPDNLRRPRGRGDSSPGVGSPIRPVATDANIPKYGAPPPPPAKGGTA